MFTAAVNAEQVEDNDARARLLEAFSRDVSSHQPFSDATCIFPNGTHVVITPSEKGTTVKAVLSNVIHIGSDEKTRSREERAVMFELVRQGVMSITVTTVAEIEAD